MKLNLAIAATAALAISNNVGAETVEEEVNEMIQQEKNIVAELQTLNLSALSAAVEKPTEEGTGDQVGSTIEIGFDDPDDPSTIVEGAIDMLTSAKAKEDRQVDEDGEGEEEEEATTTASSVSAHPAHEAHKRAKAAKAQAHMSMPKKDPKADKEQPPPKEHSSSSKSSKGEHSMSHPVAKAAKAKHSKSAKRTKAVHSLSMENETKPKAQKEQSSQDRMSMNTSSKAMKGEMEVKSATQTSTASTTPASTETSTTPATTEFTEPPNAGESTRFNITSKTVEKVARVPDELPSPSGTDTSDLTSQKFTEEVKAAMLGDSGASSLEGHSGHSGHHHQKKDGSDHVDIRDKPRANANAVVEADNGAARYGSVVLGGVCLVVSSIVAYAMA